MKTGSRLEVIEVKSKSFKEGESEFFGKRGGVLADWKPYLYDVAFQKFVVQNAFPDRSVSAFLMLVDKGSKCPTDGLNQKFRVKTSADGSRYCELRGELDPEEIDPASHILRRVCVDDACDRIFAGTDSNPPSGKPMSTVAAELAGIYERDEFVSTPACATCKDCEFRATAEQEAAGKISGYKQCWTAQFGWGDDDFAVPTVLDLWDNRSKDTMLAAGKIKLSDLTEADLKIKPADKPGMSRTERQWLQVKMASTAEPDHHIDIDGLAAEMDGWKFPLHFIDFETATPGIPFTKGRRPYEEVAFQYSHHVVHEDGLVEHAGEHLDDRIAVFPNYDFVRRLREELAGDDGTIFRYADHENSYLVRIKCQLNEDEVDIADRDELCGFIRSITVGSQKMFGADAWVGERNMVDMCDLVKRYYFHPRTKGSNSIKQVLPAILCSSKFLQEKYSRAVYGSEIRSRNFSDGIAWVCLENDEPKDPYAMLPPVFAGDAFDRLSDEDELKDGGAAMIAYARLQFEDMCEDERTAIKAALRRYCELDTLAMVMIYEGWREMIREARA